MGFGLLAETIFSFGPESGIAALVSGLLFGGGGSVVGGIVGALAGRFLGRKATPATPTSGGPPAVVPPSAPPLVRRITALLDAIAKRDQAGVLSQAAFLQEVAGDAGGVQRLCEGFVHELLPGLHANDTDRGELYELLSKLEGVDVAKAVAAAKIQRVASPLAPLVGVLAFVLCLVMGSSAVAASPERFVPQFRPAVIDQPAAPKQKQIMRGGSPSKLQQIYAELGRPQGAGSSYGCECGEACNCGPTCACGSRSSCSGRVGFWQRGKVRRGLVRGAGAVGRFIWRPFR